MHNTILVANVSTFNNQTSLNLLLYYIQCSWSNTYKKIRKLYQTGKPQNTRKNDIIYS